MEKSEQQTGNSKLAARFQFGAVSAAVFVNTLSRTDGTTFQVYRTVLQKTYVDESGQFRASSSFDVNELPKVAMAIAKAYEYCLTARAPAGDTE